ncbi:MAG: hypothetical protein CMK09_03095 [Ponticaulis sp.]|nr:hypothetical protein [Ponticaulis sp.]|tara:strand:- start:39106 stop:40074 length:969 start_codon:yes stop_codon:yes gene_type:complete
MVTGRKTQGKTAIFTHILLRFRRAIIGASLCFFSIGAIAEPATTEKPSGPAIWRLADDDTEIFLFGTVHVLPPDLRWQTDHMIEAFQSSDIIYFETSHLDQDAVGYFEFFRAGQAPPGEGVLDVLSDEQKRILSEVLEQLGLTLDSLKGQRPWYAALILGFQALEQQGQVAEYGVETWLEGKIRDDQTVRSLEGGLEVPDALSAMSMEAQIAMLMDGLEEVVSDEADILTDLDQTFEYSLKVWQKGRPEKLFDSDMEDMRTTTPEIYAAMFTDRNRKWTTQLHEVMTTETGRIFVAVGAAHLTGPESVVHMLEAEGWTVERY